ncbi:ABC transporter permease [Streptomyces sp. CA-181903]|uniref:ABC transporter permease n=1 Tax=Streptomyces sp. CA-181903 TaxID=3240055 RepID=UPI003D90B212
MTPFHALSLAMLKGFARDRITLLFTFLFPMMFVVAFGLLHSDANQADALLRMVPMLSWAVAGTGVFGMGMTVVSWRRRGLLRRIRLAPVTVPAVLLSRLATNLLVTLAQTAAFLGVVLLPVFGVRLGDRWWLSVPVILLGASAFSALGLLVGAVCRSEEAASALANFLVMPMALLSGTFFDLDQAPSWLRQTARLLPLHHLDTALLDTLTSRHSVTALLQPSTALAGFTAVTAALALRLFRWDNE